MRPADGLALRLRQGAARADQLGIACPGRFLALEERPLAQAAAREAGVAVSFDGGWSGCERAQVCFHPPEELPVFTHVWLEARWNGKFARVEHSDLLGSLMALGIDRAYVGDLVVQEGCAYLCALPEAALRLPMEWQKAGSAVLAVCQLAQPPSLTPPQGTFLRDTVPSLRLDCVLASGMRLSRAKAADIIRQGLVMVDHQPEERVDRMLSPGQLLSVRHFGRIVLRQVDGPTRKDRLPVILEVFSK